MNRTYTGCTLEINSECGIIYVHTSKGKTILRISELPSPIPTAINVLKKEMLDITHNQALRIFAVSWAHAGHPVSDKIYFDDTKSGDDSRLGRCNVHYTTGKGHYQNMDCVKWKANKANKAGK